MYTVGRAAELTGITSATLRKWEQRYGVVAPARTGGNYRLYDDDALRRLSRMRDLVTSGWAPRDAAHHLLEAPGEPGDRPATAPRGADADATEALLRAAERLDLDLLRSVLDGQLSGADLATTIDTWLLPSLVALGEAWATGRVSVAGEHFVSAGVQRRLAVLYDDVPVAPAGAPRVAVGLARGSRHELGVLAFATVLRERGAAVTYLGADLPTEDWLASARADRPDVAVLGVPVVADVPAVSEVVTALALSQPGLPVLLGGAFQDHVGMGEQLLGHSVREAAEVVVQRASV